MKTYKVTYKTISSNTRKSMYAEAENDIQAMNICSANFLGAIPLYAEIDTEIMAGVFEIELCKVISAMKGVDFYDIKNLKEVNGDWSFELGKGTFAVELTPKKTMVKKISYMWETKVGLWD